MSEAWTGRKYRGKCTGNIYEIQAEPFTCNGLEYVPYGLRGTAGVSCEQTRHFESDDYERVRAPKYGKGDRVVSFDGGIFTIDSVSSVVDFENDFVYIVIGDDGHAAVSYDCLIERKVSE